MKILYWTPLFWPEIGGIEVQAMKTLPLLRDLGHDLMVVTSHGNSKQPDKIYHEGIPVHRFHFWSALANHDLGRLHTIQQEVTSLKKMFKPDVIHINFSGYTAYVQLTTGHECPAPVVIRLASSLAECRAGPDTVLGRLLRTADWVAAVSEATLADARHVLADISACSSVIHTGLEPPRIAPSPLPFKKPRIVCLGRLAHEKGFDLVITACASLIRRYPHVSLTIAGDGPERVRLEQQVSDLGLNNVVEFAGKIHTHQVPELFNMATVVVVPSRFRDPLPLVTLEAAQMARPIVASRVGGIPESVLHQKTGLLVEKEDASALTDAVALLLDHPEKARQMGQAARKRALEVFAFERYVDAYDTLYRKVFNRFQKRKEDSV